MPQRSMFKHRCKIERSTSPNYGEVGDEQWGYVVTMVDGHIEDTVRRYFSALRRAGYFALFRSYDFPTPVGKRLFDIKPDAKQADEALYDEAKKVARRFSRETGITLVNLTYTKGLDPD